MKRCFIVLNDVDIACTHFSNAEAGLYEIVKYPETQLADVVALYRGFVDQ